MDAQRFYSNVAEDGDCWIWRGTRDRYGYGRVYVAGKTLSAHRFSYEEFVGPIPCGLEIDHVCRTKASETTYIRPTGFRDCRVCNLQRVKRYEARRRQAAA